MRERKGRERAALGEKCSKRATGDVSRTVYNGLAKFDRATLSSFTPFIFLFRSYPSCICTRETNGNERRRGGRIFCARKKKLTPPPPPSRRRPSDPHGRGRWTNPREGNKKRGRDSFVLRSGNRRRRRSPQNDPPSHLNMQRPSPPPSHLPRNLMFCFLLLLLHGWRFFSPAVQKKQMGCIKKRWVIFCFNRIHPH